MLDWIFGKTTPKEVFLFDGVKGSLTPAQLGYYSVKWAIDSTSSTVMKMADAAITEKLQDRINEDPGIAQLHLILYELSACYVYCSKILNTQEKVLIEILSGYKEGLATMRKGASPKELESMLGFIIAYAKELHSEINNPDSIQPRGSSPSASRALKEIFLSYESIEEMETDRLDELALEGYVCVHGIFFIRHLHDDMKLKFNA